MTARSRGKTGEQRSVVPFGLSLLIHGVVISWLLFGPSPASDEKPLSLYDQEIRPHEKRIVWYRMRDRLPDISPAGPPQPAPAPPRARRKFTQTIVAGPRDDANPSPMIRTPAPEVAASKLPPLPNLVAVTDIPRPVRPFARPTAKTVATAAPALPDAPRVAPPPPDQSTLLASALAAPVRKFAAPVARTQSSILPALPDAPQIVSRLDPQGLPLPDNELRAPTRAFQSPHVVSPGLSPVSAELAEAPAASSAISGAASLAIVSLTPADLPEPPVPPGAHDAAFSAGPKPRDGAAPAPAPAGASTIAVPGLQTRDGARDQQPSLIAGVVPSRQNLMSGLRNPPPPGSTPDPPAASRAARVSSAPDPLLAGRLVYSIAIQMPNITSYSGSWMVWFAEREGDPKAPSGEVRPPVPLRKVDPRYVAAAADERVEGIVRLSAVIRKDGQVEAVTVVRRLDERLDRSAQEALAKWQFEPALRNGAPVDVDAIFEVPFRLLPKPAK
jgi:TonB family protein